MCQYNLIIIKDNCSDSTLTENGYHLFHQQKKNCKVYYRLPCDCGSFVSSQKEHQDISYNEFILFKKQEKIEELLRIKKLLQAPDYREQIDEYIRYLDYFQKEYSGYYDSFEEITPELEESLADTLEYKRINELSERMYEMDMKYLLSMNYILNSDDEIVTFNDKGINIDKLPIDTAIDEVRHEDNQDVLTQFNTLYSFFLKLLKITPSFEFVPIWISLSEFIEDKTVSIPNLTIEDLSKLQYNQKLIITR